MSRRFFDCKDCNQEWLEENDGPVCPNCENYCGYERVPGVLGFYDDAENDG